MTSRAEKNVDSSLSIIPHATATIFRDLMLIPLGWVRRNSMETNHISALHAKHAGLDERLRAETARPMPDAILIASIKKQKLALKQEIENLAH
jgi:hypothetical protein